MKFTLILILCSYVAGECLPPYTYTEKFVLFDLENDPGESVNLHDQKPNIVNELKSLYKAWKSKQ